MKKIAIIAQNFGGSTMSLIESFLRQGHYVDFYHIGNRRNTIGSYETFDLPIQSSIGSINEIKNMNYNGLRRFIPYTDTKQFRMFQFVCTGIHPHIKHRFIVNLISKLILDRLVNKISKNKYDFINVIGQTTITTYLSLRLKKDNKSLVHSIHEVCENHFMGDKINDFITLLIKNGIQLNVFSQKSADDLNRLTPNLSPKFSIIPFSLFTGYQEFKGIEIPELSDIHDYVLFFGFIEPYKGLANLYKAIQLLKEIGFNKKIVIAGRGYDQYLENIKRDNSFVLINRWIKNDEVVTLLKRCHVVVCPYLSSSQTGITQTVFNFEKPIIATKVPAFTSTILHKKTGLLVDIEDPIQLAHAIDKTYTDMTLYNQLCKGVKTIKEEANQKWAEIANMYIDRYAY